MCLTHESHLECSCKPSILTFYNIHGFKIYTMFENKLILECESKIDVIGISKITHITTDSIKSVIHLADNSKYYSNKSLNLLESSLPTTFIRVNRNSIVNIEYIKNINKTNRIVQIESGFAFCASTRQIRCLINLFKELSARSAQHL